MCIRDRDGSGAPLLFGRLLAHFGVDTAGTGDLFQHEGGGAPARLGAVAGEMHQATQLLAGAEIMQGHFRQRGTGDRDGSLMAIAAGARIDGERQEALAKQCIGAGCRIDRQQRLQPVVVGLGVAAQCAGVGAIGEQQRDRAVPLGLQTERTLELQRGGQSGGERDGLSGQRRHHRMVVVTVQQSTCLLYTSRCV